MKSMDQRTNPDGLHEGVHGTPSFDWSGFDFDGPFRVLEPDDCLFTAINGFPPPAPFVITRQHQLEHDWS